MSDLISGIRKLFPNAVYRPPCTPDAIAEAERMLGQRLPAELHEMYSQFDGFLLPDQYKLSPLLINDGEASSLVKFNIFIRGIYESEVQDIIFYGNTRSDFKWGVLLTQPHVIVEFHHSMEKPEIVAKSILEAYTKDEQWYKDNF